MARKRRGPAPKPQRRTGWLSIIAAYSVGLVFVAAGGLVLVFGKAEPQAGEKPMEGSVARLGVGLIVLGLLALAMIGYMHWVKRKA
ncbi:MAG TPA: hypothetical protein VNE39_23975 [Planctomycetota bacterium]|nr:hypothetical protein [Planctomycetota bacterium]